MADKKHLPTCYRNGVSVHFFVFLLLLVGFSAPFAMGVPGFAGQFLAGGTTDGAAGVVNSEFGALGERWLEDFN